MVKKNASVGAGSVWLVLNGAVVRGEDLIGIEILEYAGGGFPDFTIEHLAQVGSQMKFDRFRKFILYVAVVSTAPEELDAQVEARLDEIATKAPCEVRIRMYSTEHTAD